jgi:hypothetical protein
MTKYQTIEMATRVLFSGGRAVKWSIGEAAYDDSTGTSVPHFGYTVERKSVMALSEAMVEYYEIRG